MCIRDRRAACHARDQIAYVGALFAGIAVAMVAWLAAQAGSAARRWYRNNRTDH